MSLKAISNRREVIILTLCATILIFVLSACRSPRRTEPVTGGLKTSDPALVAGQKAFDQHCHSCHPDGDGGLGPSLNDKPLPGTLMAFQVRHGLGVMPAFDASEISGEELDAIVAYLKALRRSR